MAAPAKTTEPEVRKSTDSAGRRRSSAGIAGLQGYKRESPAHAARRESIKEQTGSGGMLANIWNSTFKGDKK